MIEKEGATIFFLCPISFEWNLVCVFFFFSLSTFSFMCLSIRIRIHVHSKEWFCWARAFAWILRFECGNRLLKIDKLAIFWEGIYHRFFLYVLATNFFFSFYSFLLVDSSLLRFFLFSWRATHHTPTRCETEKEEVYNINSNRNIAKERIEQSAE